MSDNPGVDLDAAAQRVHELFSKKDQVHIMGNHENGLRAISEKSGQALRKIYVPFSSTDVSPSQAFPDADITYADASAREVGVMQKNGYKSVEADALTYDPGDVDAVILPGTEFSKPELQDLVARLVAHIPTGGLFILEDDEALRAILDSDALRGILSLNAVVACSSDPSKTKYVSEGLEEYIPKKLAEQTERRKNIMSLDNLKSFAEKGLSIEPNNSNTDSVPLSAHMFVFQKQPSDQSTPSALT